jgi:hypothetical protein
MNRELKWSPRGAWKIVAGQDFSSAQHKTASGCVAVLSEYPRFLPGEWSEEGEIRTRENILDDVRAFFKDNPAWK